MSIIYVIGMVGSIIVLLAALAKDIHTNTNYRLGQASPMEVRESRGVLAAVVVTVVIAMAAMALALHVASDFFSSNTPRGEAAQSEETTTAPATSEPEVTEE